MLVDLETLIVRDPMIAWVDATVLSAVEQMSLLNRYGVDGGNTPSTCVVIMADGQQVLGILTERDVIRLVAQQQPMDQLTLEQFLQQKQSQSISSTIPESALSDVTAVIAHFEQQKTTHLPIVTAHNQLVGVLSYESLQRLRDSTKHQATASLLASQQQILERIAKAEPLTDVLNALLQTMESHLSGTVCSITLCWDGRLTDIFAPSLPSDYTKLIPELALPIAEGVGSCGTAAFRQELVVVTDIEHDPLWHDYKSLVLGYGLQACSSIPIFDSDRNLLGVFGIYNREKKAPQAQELESIAQAANIAGIAIERGWATQALQQLNQELESRVQLRTQELQEREQFLQTVLDTCPLSVFWKDVNSVYLGCNQHFLRDAGLQSVDEIIGKTDYDLPWGETEADFYRADDRTVIETQTAKLGIVESQHQGDGQLIWLETNKLPICNLQGEVIGVMGTYQDISDRKAAEKKLILQQNHLAALLNNIPHIAWIKDEQSRFIAVNEPFAQACGISAEELVGKTDYDIWPADLAQAYRDDDFQVLESGQSKVVEEKISLANGTVGWLETTKTPFKNDLQVLAGTVGIAADITDRKLTEFALKESQAQFRRMTENVPGMIYRYVLHPNGRGELTYVSSQIREIFELEPEVALGNVGQLWRRIHPDDFTRIVEAVRYSAVAIQPFTSEYRLILPQQGLRWVYNQSHTERLEDGTIVWDGVVLDSTERKNAAITLQDLSDRLEFALKGANIGIWEWQNSDGRLLWDDRMYALYGIRPEDFSGQYEDWLQRVHPDDRGRAQQAEQQAYQGATECRVEFRIIRPDGMIRYIDSYAFNQWTAQGEIERTIGLNIDITERKQAEAQLQQSNEELARATRLKDEFLANMSHELRTPLNAILGMTEILQEQVFGDLNDRQQKSLQTIEKSGSHLLELINDILDVAKIEAGQIELNCQPSNVAMLCQSSLAFIKQQAFNKKIQLESVIPSDLPEVGIDERRIRQVLINLLNNAVKFTPSGGKVTIQVNYIQDPSHIVISNEIVACGTLEISVVDTGIGIAPDQINRLFQPFVQVESALNRNYNGTGLGLALVKRLVELHGGHVGLTSELGVGSCFTITIPVATLVPISVAPDPSDFIHSKVITPDQGVAPVILLAEDNESNINTFVDYLSLKGYRLVVANNGQMAINLAQQIHPDVILMDIQMPGMDGLEAIRYIRQQSKFAHTPIIALTALAMTGDRERCLDAGANDYLSKPVKLQQLINQINDYLNLN